MLVPDDIAKNAATVYIPYDYGDLLQPAAVCERYKHRSPLDLLVSECYRANELLAVVQQFSGRPRPKLTTGIGRKTVATRKLY